MFHHNPPPPPPVPFTRHNATRRPGRRASVLLHISAQLHHNVAPGIRRRHCHPLPPHRTDTRHGAGRVPPPAFPPRRLPPGFRFLFTCQRTPPAPADSPGRGGRSAGHAYYISSYYPYQQNRPARGLFSRRPGAGCRRGLLPVVLRLRGHRRRQQHQQQRLAPNGPARPPRRAVHMQRDERRNPPRAAQPMRACGSSRH